MARKINGFTLIELLVVIAILGILAAAIIVAINPNKRLAQARDAQRKNDVSAIANALAGYGTLHGGTYPKETQCDSSLGEKSSACTSGTFTTPYGWNKTTSGNIYDELVTKEQFLKELPKDPINGTINGTTYYYIYEPGSNLASAGNNCDGTTECSYWIGALLEAPSDSNKPIFRCTDKTSDPGCKEVVLPFDSGNTQ